MLHLVKRITSEAGRAAHPQLLFRERFADVRVAKDGEQSSAFIIGDFLPGVHCVDSFDTGIDQPSLRRTLRHVHDVLDPTNNLVDVRVRFHKKEGASVASRDQFFLQE